MDGRQSSRPPEDHFNTIVASCAHKQVVPQYFPIQAIVDGLKVAARPAHASKPSKLGLQLECRQEMPPAQATIIQHLAHHHTTLIPRIRQHKSTSHKEYRQVVFHHPRAQTKKIHTIVLQELQAHNEQCHME
jgi:hypothetical protein